MNEKKTYIWRGISVIIGLLGLIYSYIMIYSEELHIYEIKNNMIIFIFGYRTYTDAIYFIFLTLLITSIFTFFISDKIFKKWLIFTPFYLLLTAFLVYKAPVSAGGALGIGPTKELVSIWMGILFAIISTIMFIWMSFKEKK